MSADEPLRMPRIEPTTAPCPDWCARPHGHGYEHEADHGSTGEVRYHERGLGRADGVTLALVAAERITIGPAGVEIVIEPTRVQLALDEDYVELDATAARALAMWLESVAGMLDPDNGHDR